MPADTDLHKAANQGDEAEVEDLLRGGAAINGKGAQGRTPLHRALGSGHRHVVEILLERKADVAMQDSMKRTSEQPPYSRLPPSHAACRTCH